MKHMYQRLFTPLDALNLVIFRVAFGVIMVWEVWRYFHYDRIFRYYVAPEYTFTYYFFDWIQPLPGDGMYFLFYFMALLGAFIALGLFYRLSMTLFFFVFTYVFLLDATQYLNHFYLVCIISFLMIFIPMHRAYSLDNLLNRLHPALGVKFSPTIPAWGLWLLILQLWIVYTYAGIAKLNQDWLRGEPLRLWMSARTDFPIIGRWFTEEWLVYAFSYGGMLLDLLVVPGLLWRRTRPLALAAGIGFHLTNSQLFNIGIFPWFMIASMVLFLPPSWLRWRWSSPVDATPSASIPRGAGVYAMFGLLAVFIAIQIAMPLRHFFYPGEVSWNEHGHNLAWHMRLRSKSSDARFFVTDAATRITREINPYEYLTTRQYNQMTGRPDMILQFAHYLAGLIPAETPVEVRAWVMTSLNNSAPQLLIDPTINLVDQPRDLRPAAWIIPRTQRILNGRPIRQPAAMIARRGDGGPASLFVINLTHDTFPLESLRLVREDATFSASEWNIPLLEAEACVSAHPPADAHPIPVVICNEDARLRVPPFWDGDFDVYYEDTFITRCRADAALCVVALELPLE